MIPPAPPRRFRLQISLRMLLALMAVVGVALAVFRWPWVEVTTEGGKEVHTTYRRNWRGQPVKNGVEQIWWADRLKEEAHYYEGERQGPRRIYDDDGRLTMEAHYRAGRLHGPFRAGNGFVWGWEGNHHDGKPHGGLRHIAHRQGVLWIGPPSVDSWFDVQPADDALLRNLEWFNFPADHVIAESNWNHGQRHGPFTLKSPSGEVLHTAEYDHDALVSWNGEPIVEQFRQWLVSPEVNQPHLAQLLFAKYPMVTFEGRMGGRSTFGEYAPGSLVDDQTLEMSQGLAVTRVLMHLHPQAERKFSMDDYSVLERGTAAEALCEWAVLNGFQFQYRYGAIWLVLAADPEPPFVDRTGIAQIEFPPGSQQAREWNEEIDVHELSDDAASCVELLLLGTSLPHDTDAIVIPLHPENFDLLRTAPPKYSPAPVVFRRSRRDALGFVLFRTGCRCDLRDGKLTFFPRAGRTEYEQQTRPLQNSPH